ncbi:hypothetical protein ABB34_09450 [Stenotrophomonas daejeonensis]|uniref:DUF11 domain-containing protein n=1 Tax=Stenotrophomonas daejeonensis TaxID=659018 RepID=A0A0R0DS80_9GAMM|nr:SdrD B-like domain-containing protein [Stenotrophomonas daejeonensis]KRG84341.1 hypothetical protein ABB34_09450 [Stenotrophomonas daejeonensis]
MALAALLALPLPALAENLQFSVLANAGDSQVPVGAAFKYQVEVQNSDSSTVSDGVAIFDLPVNAVATGLPGYCFSEGVNQDTDRERIRCNLPELVGLNSKVNFEIEMSSAGMAVGAASIEGAIGFDRGNVPDVTTTVASLITNTDLFFGDDTNKADNKQSTSTAIVQSGDLRLEKVASAPSVIGGEELTYTLTVTNDGPNASAGFSVVDTLPSGVDYVADSFAGSNWSVQLNVPEAGKLTATYTGPALAASGNAAFTFKGKANVGGGTVTNSAVVVAGAMPDPDPTNNNASVSTIVTPGADLQISKTATPAPAIAGETVRFNITLTNLGPSAAENPRWSDVMPAGFVITDGDQPAGWVCATTAGDTTRGCTYAGTLPANSPVSFWVDATVPADGNGDVINTVTAASDTPDPVAANDSYPLTFSVMPDGADLGLTKSKTPKLVAIWPGSGPDDDSRMTSVIQVRNYGPKAATGNVQVVDTLPLGEEFLANLTPANWSCAAVPASWDGMTAQVVTCDLVAGSYPLARNTNAPELRLQTRARSADLNLRNEACTGGSGGSSEPATSSINEDRNTDNDCAGDGTRTTDDRVDLELAKTTNAFGGNGKTLRVDDDSFTYTLRVTNKDLGGGSVRATGIVVNDAIPGYVPASAGLPATAITATTSSGWPCTVSAGSVVCRSGSAGLDPGASEDITISVTRPLMDSALASGDSRCAGQPAGSFCNTAGVEVDANVAGSVGEIEGGNNQASDWLVVEKRANVRTVDKQIPTGTTGQVGVNTNYVMSWINEGPSLVPGVVFRDTFTLPANDAGFVLVSATRTRQGQSDAACTVTSSTGLVETTTVDGKSYAAGASGGTLVIECPAYDLPSRYSEEMKVTIRPNVDSGNNPTGRQFANTADFTIQGGATGAGYNYNYDPSAADDEKSAVLTFNAGAAQLFVEKVDRDSSFTSGVDPLGYEPGGDNFVTYRVSVRNAGPSIATGVAISDQYRAPAGKQVQFIGWAPGTLTGPTAAFGMVGCSVNSANPFTGAGIQPGDPSLDISCEVPGAGFGGSNQAGIIGVNASSYIYLRYKYLDAPAPTGETARNYVAVSMNEAQVPGGIYSDEEQTTILARADMGVEKKVFSTAPDADPEAALPATEATEVALRQPFWWVIEAENHGPAPSMSLNRSNPGPLNGTGTVITDTLPVGMVIAGTITWEKKGTPTQGETATGTGTCPAPASPTTGGSRTITCNVGDVAIDGKVRILVPARWETWPGAGDQTNTATVRTEMVDPNPANDSDDAAIKVTRSSLAGTVFWDQNRSNGNGTKEAADTGVQSVVIRLSGTDAYGNVLGGATGYLQTTTASDGSYTFNNLSPADAAGYTLTQIQPAAYVNGPDDPPTDTTSGRSLDGDYAAGASGDADSTYTAIHVGANDAGVRYNFPEVKRPSLSGYVYVDSNHNDVRDPGEDPIVGAEIQLLDADTGTVVDTATTNGSGLYTFNNLDPLRTYILREVLPGSGEYINRPSAVTVGSNGGGTAEAEDATTDRISGIDLSAGLDGTGYNFGEDALAAISGTVYLDRDDNGDMNAGDVGIPDVEVVITSAGLDGIAGTADDIEVRLTTGSDGRYSYPGAVAGLDYTITQTQPTGLLSGQEHNSNVIQLTNLPTAGSTGNDFGELAGSIAGRVWLDTNNNGLIDAGENGIANVSVNLPAGTLDALGNPVAAVTTDANGNYRFDDLLAGTYVVTEQAAQPVVTVGGSPVTTINGTTVAGNIGGTPTGTATLVATTPSAVSGIALGAGQHSVQNDFGETLPVSVSGTVFLDINNDGDQAGAGETGLSGVTIELTGTDDTGATVSLSTTTDGNGQFSFEGLRPGTYTVTEPDQPTGTANGITTAGTVGGTSSGTATPVTTVPSEIAGIDLTTPGSASVDNLFGEIPRSSGITGKVWLDRDNDGVVDPDETGIGGVRVELEGTAIDGTTISLWTTTEPDGSYSFIELPPGTYTVTEPNQPPGTLDGKTVEGSTGGMPSQTGDTPSKIETITVGVNEISTENNFGEIPAGSISGYVYNDSNDDGIKQGDEGGYAGVTVVLSGTDDLGNPVNATVTTNPDGSYEFPNLRPGTYVVTEPDQPTETLNGKTTAGSTGGTGSNPTPTSSEITGIVLAPGDESTDNNFGEIGDSPDMLVSKSSTTVKFTVNNIGSYLIRVRNGGQKPSVGEYVVRDRLPAGLTLAGTPAGNGWTCTGAAGETRFECRSSEVVNAGATSPSEITVSVNVSEVAAKAGTVNNAVLVEGGGENEFRTPTPAERTAFDGDVTDLPVCDAGITQNACRVPNEVQLAASVGGTVWFDVGSEDTLLDGGDERLQDWIVELVDPDTGVVVKTTTTAADGSYRFGDMIPGVKLNIQFRDPNSGVLWAWPVNKEITGGTGASCDADNAIANGGVSACRTSENGNSQLQVVLKPGDHLPQQSLPVDPSGVVYDAVTRDPVPGSIVTLQPVGVCNGYDPLTAILNAGAGGYTVEGNAISMTVGNNGYYQFVFGPAAPARCEFRLTVTPPGGYRFASSLIPPQEGSLSPAGAAGTTHLVQPQATAPTGAVGADTQYWLTLFSGSATAGIVHNHIPLDTAEATGLVISKTGDRRIAEIGDTVQYTITVRQTAGSALATVNIVDTLPRGFTYIDGTARIGGRALADPSGRPGPRLGFDLGPIDVGGQLVLTYRVRVGVGAQQGDGVNRAQAHGCSIDGGCIDPVSLAPVPGSIPSNRAEYRVRVTGGVFTDEVCVLGKVFVDCNNNHVQDAEELGIPGVRLYFSNGTWVISDSEGKYSYCGLPPQSHTLKVDPSTLPVGARLTTSSNRNLGDADSLFLDLKNGELHRADFVEGSCSNPLLEQVKARRTQGEVRAPENEAGQSQLRFESKPLRAPQQATDSANQRPIVEPRPNPPSTSAAQEVQP